MVMIGNNIINNKKDVRRFDTKPRLRIIDRVDGHGISRENIRYLNQQGYFGRVPFTPFSPQLDVSLDQLEISRLSQSPWNSSAEKFRSSGLLLW
jgi:hypothetical protein